MNAIPQKFQDNELIKTTKIFVHLDPVNPDYGYGWPLPVYFDRTSNMYRVFNLPKEGMDYETTQLPSDGEFEFEVNEPVQYAKDWYTKIIKVNVR